MSTSEMSSNGSSCCIGKFCLALSSGLTRVPDSLPGVGTRKLRSSWVNLACSLASKLASLSNSSQIARGGPELNGSLVGC